MEKDSPVSKKGKHLAHPSEELLTFAKDLNCDVFDNKLYEYLDSVDKLKNLRSKFFYPKNKDLYDVDLSLVNAEDDCVYLCGNSLGLQPRGVNDYIQVELDKWAKCGVQGHTKGEYPWAFCDEKVNGRVAKLVGAQENEVGIMNGLTVNLHFLLVSFYKPTPKRHKILLEAKAFPSDHYAFESQIKFHGYDPATSMICLKPREGEYTLRTEDILKIIDEQGDEIAVVCFSGIQYYTGQLFEMEKITKVGQSKGCMVGFDLAHAVGNVEICLHDWNVDFACWCTYKYLNSSAGGIAGAFIHANHLNNDFPKLLGWWGHDIKTRFVMDNVMDLSPGVAGYRVSNPPMLLVCPLAASLDVFDLTSLPEMREKTRLLTGYMELLLTMTFPKPNNSETMTNSKPYIEIITPADPNLRGCQLSVKFSIHIAKVFKELTKRGVICDEREPNVIRFAPTPLYNSFKDVFKFVNLLKDALQAANE